MHARRHVISCLCAAPLLAPLSAFAAAADAVPADAQIQPADLAALLKSGGKPVMLQVGFKTLYDQAHIPDAQYAGPGNSDDGLANLKNQVAALPHDAAVMIYCGCCPWGRCPNIGAAYGALQAMGFGKVKALYIAGNFGTDWADKGYPVARGG